MKLIIIIVVILLVYISGFILGKYSMKDELLERYRKLAESDIKIARINMVIRSYRNRLLREETELRALPKEKQEKQAIQYIDNKAKLQLIRQIEEDVSNEMQKI